MLSKHISTVYYTFLISDERTDVADTTNLLSQIPTYSLHMINIPFQRYYKLINMK